MNYYLYENFEKKILEKNIYKNFEKNLEKIL